MGYNQSTDTDSTGLIGSQGYKSENKKFMHKLVLTPKSTSIATLAAAILQATWWTLVKQLTGRCFVTPVCNEIADNTADAQVQEFPNGDKRTISLANYDYVGYWDVPDAVLRELFTLNNRQWNAYIIWKNNLIEGYTPDGTLFNPKRVKEFIVIKRTTPDGATVQRVMFGITFDKKTDFEQDTVYANIKDAATAWDATDFTDLDSLRGVDIVASAPGAGTLTVTVKDETGVGVEGLVSADFVSSVSGPSGATDNGGGSYALTGLGAGATTITLVAATVISVSTAFIQSNGVSNSETVTA